MKCEEIMTHGIPWCVPGDTVQTAAEMMKTKRIAVLPVCSGGKNRSLVGIVTDHDIVVRVLADKRNAADTLVESVMTTEPAACFADDDLVKALDTMLRNLVERIPILNSEGELLGIVTLVDVVLWSGEPRKIGEVMAQGRESGRPGVVTDHTKTGRPKVRHGGGSTL